MDLDQDAEAAERELEDHNERLDELALFGIGIATGSNVDPVDVDAAPVTASSSPTATGGSTARDNRPRKRLATSRVWADFEEVTRIDEKGKKVRISDISMVVNDYGIANKFFCNYLRQCYFKQNCCLFLNLSLLVTLTLAAMIYLT